MREDGGKGPEDIAVLELAVAAPAAAAPAPLLAQDTDETNGLAVHCFGFPAGRDEGTRRPGTCRGENARGWVQLDVERGLVEGGFSGTGAWDPGRGGVVGLVVAARTADQAAFLIPTRTLFAAWPELDGTWRPRNPFKSLSAFGPTDEPDFFGRADLTRPLADRVTAERLITLIGPSGSGKSSLIGAGLIPELHRRGQWRCLVARPGEDPFDGLTLAQRTEERRRLRDQLADGPQGPVRVLAESLADDPDGRLLLVLDQFEELFTNTAPRDPGCPCSSSPSPCCGQSSAPGSSTPMRCKASAGCAAPSPVTPTPCSRACPRRSAPPPGASWSSSCAPAGARARRPARSRACAASPSRTRHCCLNSPAAASSSPPRTHRASRWPRSPTSH
jgi:hypothetical protein|nr:hypothetical protein [uncultured Thiodictyon sp.]